jgi:hypothetical protein
MTTGGWKSQQGHKIAGKKWLHRQWRRQIGEQHAETPSRTRELATLQQATSRVRSQGGRICNLHVQQSQATLWLEQVTNNTKGQFYSEQWQTACSGAVPSKSIDDFMDGESDCAGTQTTVLGSHRETDTVDLPTQQRVELGFKTVVTESGREQSDIGESKVADTMRTPISDSEELKNLFATMFAAINESNKAPQSSLATKMNELQENK